MSENILLNDVERSQLRAYLDNKDYVTGYLYVQTIVDGHKASIEDSNRVV